MASLHDVETLIVGAGVVGLAIARKLAMCGQEVVVLEQHSIIGSETSARNSEVVHAGIYYPKNSLKALTCVEGKKQLYEFCKSHGVPFKKLGKIIAANNQGQIAQLNSINEHAAANGVDDLRVLNKAELRNIEPNLNAVSGLFSPSTGIVDSHAYMLALQGDGEANGCQFAFNTQAKNWQPLNGGGFEVDCGSDQKITTRNLIVSGGLHASKLLNASNETFVQSTLLAKGNYFKLTGRAPFSHLIYPVPEPGGLGVHLTLDMDGQARFGPDVEWIEEIDYRVDPTRSESFYSAIRSYWPELPNDSLEPDYAGIRPKLSGPGEPNADFQILGQKDHGHDGLVALLGMESPGLTASLAIADHVHKLL